MKKDRSFSSSSVRRGSEIEVFSNKDGFKGAWFRAILEDPLSKSGNKKLTVRYLSLLAKDGSSLREATNRRFLRPIPPQSLFSVVDFEEGSIVEASHRDGWWVGEVVKKIDDDKHLVYFDSPPDLIIFKRRQLRQHFDWVLTRDEWVRPQNKVLSRRRSSSSKSMFRRGTMAEVKEETNDVVVWVPSIIVKEMSGGKRFIVKSCKYLSWNDETKCNRTISSGSVRLTPPPCSVERYELLESVEAFVDPGWRHGIVKGILRDKQYKVCLDATNESLVLKHSELRLSEESIAKRFSRNSTEVSDAITPQRSMSPVKEPSLARGSDNEMAGRELNEEAVALDITGTQTADKTQGKMSYEKTFEPMRNQNGLGNESTREQMLEERNSEDDSRKRKRGELEHNSDIDETENEPVSPVIPSPATATMLIQTEAKTQEKTFAKRRVQPVRNQKDSSSTPEKNRSSTSGVEETQVNDSTIVLPFAKKSPFWKTCETAEIVQRVPQSPHFSPLVKEAKEDFREGFALGMMVTFSSLMEKLQKLETDAPLSRLNALKDSFAELERHGFNVTTPLARINNLLALKDRQLNIMEEIKSFDKERMEESLKKRKAEEVLSEMDRKILELGRQQVVIREEMKAACNNIRRIESSAKDLEVELGNVEIEFVSISSAPW